MDFEWTGDTTIRPIIRKPTRINARSLFSLLLALLEAVRKGIALLNAASAFYAAKVKAPMDALTNAITGCLEELTKVITNAITPQKILGDLKANLTKIKLAAKDLLRAFNGLADFAGPTTKRDADTANYAILVISKEAIRIAANMAEREQELAKLDTPDVQDQVIITDGLTLRDISQRFYGTPNDWIFIAQFNSLPAAPPTGTLVLVPYRAS
jgi:nucleoid-associated protein YgaU